MLEACASNKEHGYHCHTNTNCDGHVWFHDDQKTHKRARTNCWQNSFKLFYISFCRSQTCRSKNNKCKFCNLTWLKSEKSEIDPPSRAIDFNTNMRDKNQNQNNYRNDYCKPLYAFQFLKVHKIHCDHCHKTNKCTYKLFAHEKM